MSETLDPLDELFLWAHTSQMCLNAIAEGYDSMTVHYAVIGQMDAASEIKVIIERHRASSRNKAT